VPVDHMRGRESWRKARPVSAAEFRACRRAVPLVPPQRPGRSPIVMPYLDRDIIRSFFFAFLTIILLVQVALLVDVLLSNYRYMFGEGESKLGWVLLYYVCSLPRQAAYTVPVASAVSILW